MTPIIPPQAQDAASVERATVGRRCWFWCGRSDDNAPLNVLDELQPMDAGVLFVHADGRVNLLVTDHGGQQRAFHGVELRNPTDDDRHRLQKWNHASWMPYQRQQQVKTRSS